MVKKHDSSKQPVEDVVVTRGVKPLNSLESAQLYIEKGEEIDNEIAANAAKRKEKGNG